MERRFGILFYFLKNKIVFFAYRVDFFFFFLFNAGVIESPKEDNDFFFFFWQNHYVSWYIWVGFSTGVLKSKEKINQFIVSFSFPKSVCFLGSHLIFPSDLEFSNGRGNTFFFSFYKENRYAIWLGPFFFFFWVVTNLS